MNSIPFQAARLRKPLVVHGLIALAVIAYWPSVAALHVIWTDFDSRGYSHGYLIAALCVGLLVRATPALAQCTFSPSRLGLVALPVASVLWLVAWNAGLREPYLMLFPIILWLAVLAATGFEAARQVAFPIGFLYFAIPFWGHVNPLLQWLTTQVSVLMLKAVGVATLIDGNIIHIPAGAFEVAGGCSGLHYFVVGLAVATLLGELDRDPLRRRVYLVALMGAIALVCNWVRVFTVVLAGQLTNMQSYLVRVDHYWFGWALFGAAMLGFIWFTGRGRPVAGASSVPPSELSVPSVRPVLVAAVLLAAFPASQWLVRLAAGSNELAARTMPAGKGGWTGPYSAVQDWRPVFHGATSEVLAAYRDSDARAVEVYSVVYLGQRQGAELVGYGNSLLGEQGFEQQGETVIATSHGPVIETVATDAAGRKSIIWSVYDIGGRSFVEPLRSQLWYGVTALGGRPVASLAAARAVCVPDCEGAREKLGRFFEQMGPQLRAVTKTSEG